MSRMITITKYLASRYLSKYIDIGIMSLIFPCLYVYVSQFYSYKIFFQFRLLISFISLLFLSFTVSYNATWLVLFDGAELVNRRIEPQRMARIAVLIKTLTKIKQKNNLKLAIRYPARRAQFLQMHKCIL